MTALPLSTCDAPELMPHGRLIAVAVRGADQDAAALAWTAYDAIAGVDAVHVVHAYVPTRLDQLGMGDGLRRAAQRIAQRAAQRLRAVQPGLRVHACPIAGLPTDVLIEFSAAVDVIVVGADRPDDASSSRRVAQRVQARTRAPLVCVPSGYRPSAEGRPVTVVAGERGVAQAAMRFAAEYARRHGVALQVSCRRGLDPAAAGAEWLAHEQELLDIQLAGWRQRHPFVPIIARIEYRDSPLLPLATRSALLVVTANQLGTDLGRAIRAQPHCPTAVIPD